MYFRFMIAFLSSLSMMHVSLNAQQAEETAAEHAETPSRTTATNSGEHETNRTAANARNADVHNNESDDSENEDGPDGGEIEPYYIEGSVIDLEKLLEGDPELREKYDSLSKDERKAFIESLETFNEAFQQAFQALLPD